MAAPLILRIITDARQAIKTNETVIASNTAVGRSAVNMGKDIELSARAQIAANVQQIESAQAQLAAVKALGAQMKAEGTDRIAINRAIEASQLKLDAAMGLSAGSIGKTGEAAKTAERDLGKLTRGALAGSGVAASLGRSLAFASTGFIAVAGGATLIATSIRAAEDLAAAQRRADTQLQTSGKTWAQYGEQIDSVLLKEGHLAGFTRTELLGSFTFLLRVGGNVSNSLKLVAEAADIARGRGISLQAASIALSKALGGSATALRRLGIIVPNNVTKMQALEYVQKKFAGQAKAGTTASERLGATLTDVEATIGEDLLPTFDRLADKFSDWLHRMQESGRLKRDLHEIGSVLRDIGDVIKFVDRITGSFKNTIELIIALEFSKKILGFWVPALTTLAAKFGLVEKAATAAAAAEGEAAVAGGVAAGGRAGLLSLGALPGAPVIGAGLLAAWIGSYLGSRVPKEGKAFGSGNDAGRLKASVDGKITVTFVDTGSRSRPGGGMAGTFPVTPVQARALLGLPPFRPSGHGADSPNRINAAQGFPLTPSQSPTVIWASYQLTIAEQIASVRAAMTKSTKDDIAAAKAIIERIKQQIAKGHLAGKSLLEALQAEAQALGVIQQVKDAAAQAAAARRAAAQAAASTFEIPGYLQVAQAKAEAYGKDETAILKKIIAAAEKAIASGKKNWKGIVAAYQAIASARAALAQDAQQQLIPLRLQLQLARAQATGGDQTRILLKMRAALYRALKKAKGNIQRQIDIWNQIASINSQMGNSITSAYGDYKKASLKAETEGLGLTAAQRRLLEARLSQRGPGGTVPSEGTGAAGYIIDPATGRPRRHHRYRHPGQSNNVPASSAGGGGAFTLKQTIKLDVHLDKKVIARVVTRQQQTYRSQNPSSRRGPHAATATA